MYSPEHQFKSQIVYYSEFGLTASITTRFTGERIKYRGNDPYELESYWTTDVKIDQKLFDHWAVSLQANNILDEEYSTYLTSFYDAAIGENINAEYPGSGPSLFASVSYEY